MPPFVPIVSLKDNQNGYYIINTEFPSFTNAMTLNWDDPKHKKIAHGSDGQFLSDR